MGNLFFVELIQEIPGAARYELEAIARKSDLHINEGNDRFAVVEGQWESLKAAAFVRKVSEVISRSENMDGISGERLPEGKFHVRFSDSGKCHDARVEPVIGEILRGQGRISFSDPDFIVRAYHFGIWYVTVELYSGGARDYEKRRAPMRPFFSPISIHPRHARFMVNLSNTTRGDTVLDPFCGTGGILLESGLLGRKVIGNDWSLQMSTGARLNLKYFGIRDYHISNGDFLDLEIMEPVDAILTDLPYGKNSRLSQKDLRDLYARSFQKFGEILKREGKCVVVVSDLDVLSLAEPYFSLEKTFTNRVHRSLTRYFAVLAKK